MVLLRPDGSVPEQPLPHDFPASELVEFSYGSLENQHHVVARLARLVASQKCDIIWCNGDTMVLEAASMLPAPGLPVVCHLAGDSVYYFDLLRTFAPVIDSVVAFSRALADKAAATLSSSTPVQFLSPGIEVPPASDCEYAKPPIKLAYLGRITAAIKNTLAVIPLLEELEERQVDYRLQMIGDGAAREELVSKVQALGLAAKVEFAGYLDNEEALAVMRQSHIVLLFSHSEGCPNAVLEGMAHGLVPLVNRADWVGSVIRDGESGFTYDSEAPAEGAAIVERLAGDFDEFRRVSHNAHRKVTEDFNLDHSVLEYLRTFEAAIKNPKDKSRAADIPLRHSRLDHRFIPNWATLGTRKFLQTACACLGRQRG